MGTAAKSNLLIRGMVAVSACAALLMVFSIEIARSAQPPPPPPAISPAVAVQKARQLERLGQLRPAEQLLRGALATLGGAANGPQAAGCLELLTTIYLESGRYDDARTAALRYSRLLDNGSGQEVAAGREGVNGAKRQQIAFALAEIALARDELPAAAEMLDRALALPAGLRETDPLWEARVYALKARLGERQKDAVAAGQAWTEVESRAEKVLDTPDRGAPSPRFRKPCSAF